MCVNFSTRRPAPSPAYLLALMDTVRQRLVPPARRLHYLSTVVSYYNAAQQLDTLETWWPTLAGLNDEDYRTLGLYLLHAYDGQPQTAPDAQRVLTALQPQASFDPDLATQLRYRLVQRSIALSARHLSAADSVELRALAQPGTAVAVSAGQWLHYFYPGLPLPALALRSAARAAQPAKSATRLALTTASLGTAYPNPAQTEVVIDCQLPATRQAATLHFTSLVTGRELLVVPVEGSGQAISQHVSLRSLPAGQYAYRLLVDGQPVGSPRKLIVMP